MSRSSRVRANGKLFTKANAAWERGDLRTAFQLFTTAAEAGDPSSQLDIGYFFDRGVYVKRDKVQALRWYHRAYRQGCSAAANNIATVHRDRKEYGKMVWWFRKASSMGDHDAFLDLGKAYENGVGVKRNTSRACDFYRRLLASKNVAEFSQEQAQKRLSKLDKRGMSGALVGRKLKPS